MTLLMDGRFPPPSTITTQTSLTEQNKRPLIMISYSHANAQFCKQLVNEFKKHDKQLDIWVDFMYSHFIDIWEEIASAIEKADIVLFLLSKDYFDSKSCRQEVAYATDTLRKRFIPIYIDQGYQCGGWLGIRIAGLKYICFGDGEEKFKNSFRDLLNTILG
ncbi:unnamed protein product, partial [Didymodactylos carnosus]